jgi:predicted DCC family thiol-disulfide oxidoreductase YuxK
MLDNNFIEKSLLVLFDGTCNLCDFSVNFIIKKDKSSQIKFIPSQSKAGKKIIKDLGIKTELSKTVIFLKRGEPFYRSNAALEIIKYLDSFWKYLYILKIIPAFIRNSIYDLISRKRYQWFGRKESCMIPSEDVKNRFVL